MKVRNIILVIYGVAILAIAANTVAPVSGYIDTSYGTADFGPPARADYGYAILKPADHYDTATPPQKR